MICIYLISNTQDKKTYVGQTKNFERRKKRHIQDSRGKSPTPIHRAIRKYGEDKFIFSILEECKVEDLDELEIYWIKKLDSISNGYNIHFGGCAGGSKGHGNNCQISEHTAGCILACKENSGAKHKEIAEYFNCSKATVSQVGKYSWSYLEGKDYLKEEFVKTFIEKFPPIEIDPILAFSSIDKAYVGEFSSTREVAQYILDNSLSSSKNIGRIVGTVSTAMAKGLAINKLLCFRKSLFKETDLESSFDKGQRRIEFIDIYQRNGIYITRVKSRVEAMKILDIELHEVRYGLLKNSVSSGGYIFLSNVDLINGKTVEQQVEKLKSFKNNWKLW